MKVLHVIAGLSKKSGGPARSAQGLVAALCRAGVDAWIWAINGGEPWIPGVRKAEIVVVGSRSRTVELKSFDLVHIHGIWSWKLHKVAVMCRKAGVPYVIAPRGMLEPWSLKQRWLKKRIARWLYQDRDLKLAAALHATAESEAEQFRRLGFKNKIIVSPNGVNVPEGEIVVVGSRRRTVELANSSVVGRRALAEKKVEEWLEGVTKKERKAPRLVALAEAVQAVVHHQTTPGSCPQDSGIIPNRSPLRNRGRRALFVSRMHPKKGVLELVESWARVFKEKGKSKGEKVWTCELVYTVSGPEEKAYEQKVKDRILELGMSYQDKDGTIHCTTTTSNYDFLFTGPLDDNEKWSAYARADLFVLPTYSENFGIVVAEALWAGVPVITTKGTPWAELECSASSKFKVQSSKIEERCGWWVELPSAAIGVVGSRSRRGDSGGSVEWPALDNALKEAVSLHCATTDYDSLAQMGARGHQLVAERYTWAAVCDKMVVGYRETLHG